MNLSAEQQTLVDRLQDNLSQLSEAAAACAGRPEPADEWPLSTILVHLWLVENVIWQARLKLMAAEQNPRWQYSEPDLQAAVAQYGGLAREDLLAMFAERRAGTVRHLLSLDAAGWARIGTHARFGEMDVAGLCGRILQHDDEHLEELRRRAQ